ncbi:MAG: hypothetical protein ACFBSC_16665 [Microcoleaceae cyanobacterium]
MELPRYCLINQQPVKVIRTSEGGMDVLAYCSETDQFQRRMDYLTRVTLGGDDVELVSEKKFQQQIEKIKNGSL